MAGYVDFGNDFDEAFLGIAHNFAGIFLGVVAAVALAVGFRVAPTEHLAVTPGTAFGKEETMTIRLSFSGAMETIVAAMNSLSSAITEYELSLQREAS